MNSQLILATTSPYRIEAFKFLDLPFISEGSEINENFEERPKNPEELCLCLAKLKAEAVAKKYEKGIVMGFDSIAYFQGKILEKPKSRGEASKRLQELSEKNYHFLTGIHMINTQTKKNLSEVIITEIRMRKLNEQKIDKYLKQDPTYKTHALGFNPLKTSGSTFIKEIKGSYNNILRGIPLETVVEMLPKLGFKI